MQSVLEGPNDTVPKLQTEFFTYPINEDVERKNLAFLPNMVPDLPTKAPSGIEYADAFPESIALELQIVGK
jgi:hypothetical protein